MILHQGRPAIVAAAVLALLGCASSVDREETRQRSERLYASRSARSTSSADSSASSSRPRAALPDEADLEGYLRFGLEHSADLRAAFEDWRAAAEHIERVSTLPDPRLSFGEFLEEVQTRTGPQRRRFGLSQSFPWPGELGQRAEVAKRQAEAKWQSVEAQRLAVVMDIEVAFHEYAFLGRELHITAELLGLLRGLEPVVQSQVVAGRGQEDILRLQVEIGRLEDDLASLVRRRPALSARLADALNWHSPERALLPLPELREPELHPIDVEQSRARALASHPGLLELLELLESARAAEELASFLRRPSFGLGIDYIQTGAAAASSVSRSGRDPLLLGLSISLPIWVSSYSAAERGARHMARAAQERFESLQSSLAARVEEEAYRIDDANRRIALFRESLIPRASEALELTLASYRTGTASILDLIDSERALLEFELSFWRACRDSLQSAARLRALTTGVSQ